MAVWSRGPAHGNTVTASPHQHVARVRRLREEIAAQVRDLGIPELYAAVRDIPTRRLLADFAVHQDLTWQRYWFVSTAHQRTVDGRPKGLESFDTFTAATRRWATSVTGAANLITSDRPYSDIMAAHLNACVYRAELDAAQRCLGEAIRRHVTDIQARGDLHDVAHGIDVDPETLWEVCRGRQWT